MHDYNAVDISHSLSMDFGFVFETYTNTHMHTTTTHAHASRNAHTNTSLQLYFGFNETNCCNLHCTNCNSHIIHIYFLFYWKTLFFYYSIQMWNVFVCFMLHSEWTVTSILHTSKKKCFLVCRFISWFQVRFAFRLQFLSRWFMHVYSIRWRRNKNEIETLKKKIKWKLT